MNTDLIDLAIELGLSAIKTANGVIIKGKDWASKEITNDGHLRNTVRKHIFLNRASFADSYQTLTTAFNKSGSPVLREAHAVVSTRLKRISKLFPEVKF